MTTTCYQAPAKESPDMKILGIEEFTDSNKIWKMLCAEFIGTFFLVLIGCGTIMYVEKSVLVVQVALTFGLVIAAMAQSIGHVSGCHINPAITLSFLLVGKCSILKSICYIIMQCTGAASGFYILTLITPSTIKAFDNNLGNTFLAEHLSTTQGTVVEILATFLLVFVVHAVCDERRSDVKMVAPLLIGLTACVCHLFAGWVVFHFYASKFLPLRKFLGKKSKFMCSSALMFSIQIKYTGSSLNPARSFGPSLVYGIWQHHWVYWAGPIVGGLFAALIYKLLFQVRKGEEEANSYDFS